MFDDEITDEDLLDDCYDELAEDELRMKLECCE